MLALKLIVVEDETATARMRARWEGRDQRQVRPPARIAASLIKRARPVVMKEAGRAGGRARWRAVNPRLRGRLMSELAKLRWNAKRSALAPEPQQKPAGAP